MKEAKARDSFSRQGGRGLKEASFLAKLAAS
jgi:hypothetical protein